MKNSFKLIVLLALANCSSSNACNIDTSSPIQLNKPALKSNSEVIAAYEVLANSKTENKKANSSFVLSGSGELTATVKVNGILNVNTTPSNTISNGDSDLNLGTMSLTIQYNGVNETIAGRPYAGKTFKMYAYSEGLIGKLRESDAVGIKLTATAISPENNTAQMNLNTTPITLSSSRNLGNLEPYNNVNPSVLVASWDVNPSNVQSIKNTINLNVTGLFGSSGVPKSAQDYLGNIGFFFVAEDSQPLANGDVLQTQMDSFSSNGKVYIVSENNPSSLPYSVKIVADNISLPNQVKITTKSSSSSQNSDIVGKLKSGVITATYNSRKIFIKKINSNLRIINGENETEFRDYQ